MRTAILILLVVSTPILLRAEETATNLPSTAFVSVDRDRSGGVSPEEYLRTRARSIGVRFRAIDRNQDRLISRVEFDTAMQASAAQRQQYANETGEEIDAPPAFADIDGDGDGKLDEEEFLAAQQQAMRQRFKVLDVDRDGVLSPAEFEEARRRLLELLRQPPSPAKTAP